MKKTLVLTLAVVMVLLTAGIASAFDGRPEIYLDLGFGSDYQLKDNQSTNGILEDAWKMKGDGFNPYILGFEYPVGSWKFDVEYQNIPSFEFDSYHNGHKQSFAGKKPEIDMSMESLKAGYRVVNTDQCNLFIDAMYLRNTVNMDGLLLDRDTSGDFKCKTTAFLVGPEVEWQFNHFTINGFIGYGISGSQKLNECIYGDEGNVIYTYHDNADDESMMVYNFKFGYMFTDRFGLNFGYRSYQIKSTYKIVNDGDVTKMKVDDSNDFWTLGAVFKF